MDIQLSEIFGFIILIVILAYQEWTQRRIKKEIKPYKIILDKTIRELEDIDLKKVSDTIIKFIEDIQKSGVLDKP